MRGRAMFAGGLAVGYLLGSKAGRQRYDQIVATARKFWESPTVQEAAGVVQAQANKLYDQGKQVVTEKLHRENNGRSPAALVGDADEEAAREAQQRRAQFAADAF